jgi:hypothetical protein
MWFKLANEIINQDNVLKISTESFTQGVRLYATLTNSERVLLGVFETSAAALSCIGTIQDHIQKQVEIIDLQPLVNLANLAYGA